MLFICFRPLLVDLTIEEGTRLKVIYGSADGFHAVDLDTASVYDIYIPKHVSNAQIIYQVVLFNLVFMNLIYWYIFRHREQ